MTEDPFGAWPAAYAQLSYADPGTAAQWLARVFGLRERVRMAGDDGNVIVAKLQTPDGGLVVIGGMSTAWVRERVADFNQPDTTAFPYLTHAVTVIVDDVDAHHQHARAAGALTLNEPTDQPWGLRTYVALDLEGHQWEFAQRLDPAPLEAWGATLVQ